MSAEPPCETQELSRHPSLDERFDPDVRIVARYAALKREVAARAPGDRLAYMEGKDAYLTALEKRALAWTETGHSAGSRTRHHE